MRLLAPWQIIGAGLAMLYAVATLIVAATSADLGFFVLGGDIWTVEEGSEPARAGIVPGDRIVGINGVLVEGSEGLVALRSLPPGEDLNLLVEREGGRISVSFHTGHTVPVASAAGIVLAGMLLALALFADRGSGDTLTRAFFVQTLVYMVLGAGAFSFQVILDYPGLAVPWFFAMALAAPLTCRSLLSFPIGTIAFSHRDRLLLYGPALALATAISAGYLVHLYYWYPELMGQLLAAGGVIAILMAALYLTVGAVARIRRMHRRRTELDPVAVRWLQLNSAFMAVPLVAGVMWAIRDVDAFIAGGFGPFIAMAMVGGSAFLTLAFTRTPFGGLDRLWRQSSGYLLATIVSAGLYLALIGAFGGAVSALSGGDFEVVLAATLAAAIAFGPLRKWLQNMVDERFARSRLRARRMLREAAESAVATLDINQLYTGLVTRVRAALSADGAAIFVADTSDGQGCLDPKITEIDHEDLPEYTWTRVAVDGEVCLEAISRPGDTHSDWFREALIARTPVLLPELLVAVPLCDAKVPTVLVVAPAIQRTFDDEELELLMISAAHLVVALRNARAHHELEELNERLRREVDIAERRRCEIARLKERLEAENRELIGQLASRSGRAPVIGTGLRQTFDLVQKVAHSDASVLVRGETGVGKELVARAIHASSGRRDGPFIVVDCGAIAAGVFESALFGHERGAFTGAVRATLGAFRSAHGGTIFLDEIGELPLDLQPKLLRVLQEREVIAVGSNKPEKVDVRVVAGTNRDLDGEVAGGGFRQDLLYRLKVVEIVVPPLRQRRGDIPALADHFLSLIAQRSGRPVKHLSPEAMTALCEYDWPGNVRELEHALEAAAVYAETDDIRPPDLPIYDNLFVKKAKRVLDGDGGEVVSDGPPKAGLRATLEELEKQRLIEALEHHGGNRTRTAKALGMSRGALLRRLKRYRLIAHP